MAPIPRYWYVESVMPGVLPEKIPVDALRPTPSGGFAVLIDADGEVHGEAVLMCALPWPRFRGFSDGQEVVLPAGMAEALEGFEAGLLASDLEPVCPYCVNKLREVGFHLRIEVVKSKVFASVFCNAHFRISSKAKPNVGRGDKPRRRYPDRIGEDLSRASENACNGYERVKGPKHYIPANGRVLDI